MPPCARISSATWSSLAECDRRGRPSPPHGRRRGPPHRRSHRPRRRSLRPYSPATLPSPPSLSDRLRVSLAVPHAIEPADRVSNGAGSTVCAALLLPADRSSMHSPTALPHPVSPCARLFFLSSVAPLFGVHYGSCRRASVRHTGIEERVDGEHQRSQGRWRGASCRAVWPAGIGSCSSRSPRRTTARGRELPCHSGDRTAPSYARALLATCRRPCASTRSHATTSRVPRRPPSSR